MQKCVFAHVQYKQYVKYIHMEATIESAVFSDSDPIQRWAKESESVLNPPKLNVKCGV